MPEDPATPDQDKTLPPSQAGDPKPIEKAEDKNRSARLKDWLENHPVQVGLAFLVPIGIFLFTAGGVVMGLQKDIANQGASLKDIKDNQAQADGRLEVMQKEFRDVTTRLAETDRRVEATMKEQSGKLLANVTALQASFEVHRAAADVMARMASPLCGGPTPGSLDAYRDFARRYKATDLSEGMQADLFDLLIKATAGADEVPPFTEADLDHMAAVVDRQLPATSCSYIRLGVSELYLRFGAGAKARAGLLRYIRDQVRQGSSQGSLAAPYALVLLADVADDRNRDDEGVRRAIRDSFELVFEIRPIDPALVSQSLQSHRDMPVGRLLRERLGGRYSSGLLAADAMLAKVKPDVKEKFEGGRYSVSWVDPGAADPSRRRVKEYPGFSVTAYPPIVRYLSQSFVAPEAAPAPPPTPMRQ